jgi:hypothetical protein
MAEVIKQTKDVKVRDPIPSSPIVRVFSQNTTKEVICVSKPNPDIEQLKKDVRDLGKVQITIDERLVKVEAQTCKDQSMFEWFSKRIIPHPITTEIQPYEVISIAYESDNCIYALQANDDYGHITHYVRSFEIKDKRGLVKVLIQNETNFQRFITIHVL